MKTVIRLTLIVLFLFFLSQPSQSQNGWHADQLGKLSGVLLVIEFVDIPGGWTYSGVSKSDMESAIRARLIQNGVPLHTVDQNHQDPLAPFLYVNCFSDKVSLNKEIYYFLMCNIQVNRIVDIDGDKEYAIVYEMEPYRGVIWGTSIPMAISVLNDRLDDFADDWHSAR